MLTMASGMAGLTTTPAQDVHRAEKKAHPKAFADEHHFPRRIRIKLPDLAAQGWHTPLHELDRPEATEESESKEERTTDYSDLSLKRVREICRILVQESIPASEKGEAKDQYSCGRDYSHAQPLRIRARLLWNTRHHHVLGGTRRK